MKGNTKQFVEEAFDYRERLINCSIDRSVNMYLLEYVADGLATYGGVDGFIKNANKWLKSVCKIYKEIGFDYETNQVRAVIDLQDQLIVIDNQLYDDLKYIIDIISKYGLLIKYGEKGSSHRETTTLCRFFENIENLYPTIKNRYKGLGSSKAEVSKEILMDPKTRRLIKVTMNDARTAERLGALVGEGKKDVLGRKEIVSNFKFDKTMIDN